MPTPPKGTPPVPELDTTTVGTFEDPPSPDHDPDDFDLPGDERDRVPAAEATGDVLDGLPPVDPSVDETEVRSAISSLLDREEQRISDEAAGLLTAAPAPVAQLSGRVTFVVPGANRAGLIEAAVEALRDYRPEVRGWWVTLEARRDSAHVWEGDFTAYPWSPGLPNPMPLNNGEEGFYIEVACPNCPTDGHGRPTRTGWTVESFGFPEGSTSPPYALFVTPNGENQHVDAADVRWLQGIIARELTGQHPLAREEALVEILVEAIAAFRETRDFVDPNGGRLPAVAGWRWFDWLTAAQELIGALGFTNANEWHPEAEGAARQAHVPAPPVTARPAPREATEEFEGFYDRKGRPGNGDADMTGDITGVEILPEPQAPTAAMGLIPMPHDPSEPPSRRTSGGTPAIVTRPDPSMPRSSLGPSPRKRGRLRSAIDAWKAAGTTAAPRVSD